MKFAVSLVALMFIASDAYAQVASASQNLVANKITDGNLPFDIFAEGKKYPIIWGLDTAWPDEGNIKRGTAFIGKEHLGTGRVSFQPSDLIVDGQLSSAQKSALDNRLRLIKLSGVTSIALNCDHEVLCNGDNFPNYQQNAANYKGKAEEWVKLFKATVEYCRNKGFTVVSISPFNEPDFTNWNQGTKQDFLNIIKLMRQDSFFDGIRICGGNTLNCDKAAEWYNYLKEYLDEGNTHQLAGSFNNYANFFSQVKADGKHGTADELHNVMEAMVGVEYGMQTGIWWGFDGLARGEFCRASAGDRLAYAEDRTHWTAASVYRNNTDSKVQAFIGTSERQANPSSYRFISTDRDVFYDGVGPTREFVIDMPGGKSGSYQNGQTNAERVVNITWGEDVAPYIDGNYVLMNVNSGLVLSLAGESAALASTLVQRKVVDGATYQQWSVKPVESTVGGDFSYYAITSLGKNGYRPDVLNWALNAADIIAYTAGTGANQQWYLEYAGNGNFYIRSRHSTLYLEVQNGSRSQNAKIRQNTFAGTKKQQWRFVPVGEACEQVAPAAPTELTATPQSASIRLDWAANTEEDIASYTVVRAEAEYEGAPDYNTIGRGITGTAFVDNSAVQGVSYLYKIKAVDKSGNISESSAEITASTSGEKGMIAQLQFEADLTDNTINMFNAASMNKLTMSATHKSGEKAASLTSGSNYIQLPTQIANMREMTICTWVNLRSTTAWQRIFDFGNGTENYMFLTPSNGSEMRFVMKNGGDEEILSASKLGTFSWAHIAVSIGDDAVTLYINGEEVAKSTNMTIRPSDIKPVMNYIGRSQFSSDPMIKAYIDDFRVYNYALSQEEIMSITEDLANGIESVTNVVAPVIATEYYSTNGTRLSAPQKGINIVKTRHADGKVSIKKVIK
jgi:hypothetical protein